MPDSSLACIACHQQLAGKAKRLLQPQHLAGHAKTTEREPALYSSSRTATGPVSRRTREAIASPTIEKNAAAAKTRTNSEGCFEAAEAARPAGCLLAESLIFSPDRWQASEHATTFSNILTKACSRCTCGRSRIEHHDDDARLLQPTMGFPAGFKYYTGAARYLEHLHLATEIEVWDLKSKTRH